MKIKQTSIYTATEISRGVFWVIDDKLLSFPFISDVLDGVAKSGNTYNHKKLWPKIRPKNCNKPYNYYPRGRVDINNRNEAVIYLNPNIEEFIPQIRTAFGLHIEPKVHLDYSDHYKCYLDTDWISE